MAATDSASAVELARLLSGYPQLIGAVEQSLRDASAGALTTATTHSTKLEWSNPGSHSGGGGGGGGGTPSIPATSGCRAGTTWCAVKQRCIGPGENCTATPLPPMPVPPTPIPAHAQCLASAGYVWCPAKQSCIRPWEEQCTSTPAPVPDSHGCFADGGYEWCAAKQKCLRPWIEPCMSPKPTPIPAHAQCLTSAGYVWCPAKQSCIRPWEEQCTSTPAPVPDSHGCYTDGGYEWCAVKQKCLRPWIEPCVSPKPTPSVPAIFVDSISPLPPIIPTSIDAPLVTMCDFPSPFVCSPGQMVSAPSIAAQVSASFLPSNLSIGTHAAPAYTEPAFSSGAATPGGAVQWYQSGQPNLQYTEPAFSTGAVTPGGAVQWFQSGQPNLQYTSDFNPSISNQTW